MPTRSAPTPPAAADIDEFRLIRSLGSGGMGAVYLAHDTILDRPVALKLMKVGASEEHRLRFLTEARALARLDHPNVVSIYRAGLSASGEPYLVQELVAGSSLDRIELPVPPARALELAIGITRGLATAHRRGVLHRDIKPSNIMIDETGAPRLLDFGLAKLTGAATAPVGELTSWDRTTEARPVATQDETGAGPSALAATAELRPPTPTPSAAAAPLTGGGGEFAATADLPAPSTTLPAARASGAPRPASRPPASSSAHDEAVAEPTSTGVILGTPRYMAPEVWRGEPATARSDLYSLGALLHELVTGAPPFPQPDRESLQRAVLEGPPAPPLAVPGLSPELAALIASCLTRAAEERPESADLVLFQLERIAAGAPPIPEGSPYRGLAPFEAEQRALFFGRGAEISAVVDRLRGEPVVVVTGDSGIGKSSLCRAGVLPAVAAGALAGARRWDTGVLTPGARAAAALLEALGLPPADDAHAFDAQPLRAALARRFASPERGLLLLLDQAEELVTLSPPAEAARASAVLAALGRGVPGVKLVIAVRGDFLTRVAALPGLRGVMTASLHLVRGLSPEDARAVVVEPARAKGVRFESEELVRSLVDSILERPAALPLLQFALAELWSHRDVPRAVIPQRALAEIGGVAGALASHADRVLTALGGPERIAARRLLLALVSAEGTRRSRARGELLGGGGPASATALEALVRGRLVAARDVAEGDPVYELAHESLLSAWGTLRGWLDDAAGQRGLRARLGAAADEWHRLGRRRELLWRRSQLAEAAALTELTDGDRAFLDASRRAVRGRVVLAVALAAAIPAAAGLTWWSAALRERQRREELVDQRRAAAGLALRDARAALAEATGLREQAAAMFRGATAPRLFAEVPELSRALAAHYRQQDEARNQRWSSAQRRFDAVRAQLREASRLLEGALQLGARRRELTGELADVVVEQLALADALGDDSAISDLEPRLAEYDDGARLARWRRPVAVQLRATGATAIVLERYQPAADGRLSTAPVLAGSGAALATQLPPGSYRARITAAGIEPVLVPFLLRRERPLTLDVPLPAPGQVPPGFAYIPAGAFLCGAEDHQQPDLAFMRRRFFSAPPQHETRTGAYLIGRHEVTFADWLRFLRTLTPDELARRRQSGDPAQERIVRLEGDGRGPFTLILRPLGRSFTAAEGEPLRFPDRTRRQSLRWEQTPAAGLNRDDAEAFAAWLARTGQVPGARLCTPLEWERAARGADGRRYPHGNDLRGDEANIDETYSREAIGPDEVGTYPASASPFGLLDMAGNAFELVANGPRELAMRGGSWWNGALTATAMNATAIQPTRRDPYIGLRLCASWPPPSPPDSRPGAQGGGGAIQPTSSLPAGRTRE